jgi:hypothetical protein
MDPARIHPANVHDPRGPACKQSRESFSNLIRKVVPRRSQRQTFNGRRLSTRLTVLPAQDKSFCTKALAFQGGFLS